jgi:hypothetical protein
LAERLVVHIWFACHLARSEVDFMELIWYVRLLEHEDDEMHEIRGRRAVELDNHGVCMEDSVEEARW